MTSEISIFDINYTTPSPALQSFCNLTFIGGHGGEKVTTSTREDGRRFTVGTSEICKVLKTIWAYRDGGVKPPAYMKGMIHDKLMNRPLRTPAIVWGNLWEDTAGRATQCYYNCKIIYPNGGINMDHESSITCSPDGLATANIPYSWIEEMKKYDNVESPEHANMLKTLLNYKPRDKSHKIRGIPIKPNLTAVCDTEASAKVNILLEFKCKYSCGLMATAANKIVKEDYSLQVLFGIHKTNSELGVLCEYDFKECLNCQFDFTGNHLGNLCNYGKISDIGGKSVRIMDFDNESLEQLALYRKAAGNNVSYYPEYQVKMIGAKVYLINKDSSLLDYLVNSVNFNCDIRAYRMHGCTFDEDVFVFDLPTFLLSEGSVGNDRAIILHKFDFVDTMTEMVIKCGYIHTEENPSHIVEKFIYICQTFVDNVQHLNLMCESENNTDDDDGDFDYTNAIAVFAYSDFAEIKEEYLKMISSICVSLPEIVVGAHPWKNLFDRHHMYPKITNLPEVLGVEQYCMHVNEYLEKYADADVEDVELMKKIKDEFVPLGFRD